MQPDTAIKNRMKIIPNRKFRICCNFLFCLQKLRKGIEKRSKHLEMLQSEAKLDTIASGYLFKKNTENMINNRNFELIFGLDLI